MPEISLRVLGIPKGQPRPRAFVRHTAAGPIARVFDSGSAESFKSEIAIAAKAHLPERQIDAAVTVDAVFLFPRPKRLLRKNDPQGRIPQTGRPDVDNLYKAFADACTHLGFWFDDSQVHDVRLRKLYVAIGEQPGAEIRIAWPDDVQPGLLPPRRPQPQHDAPL